MVRHSCKYSIIAVVLMVTLFTRQSKHFVNIPEGTLHIDLVVVPNRVFPLSHWAHPFSGKTKSGMYNYNERVVVIRCTCTLQMC